MVDYTLQIVVVPGDHKAKNPKGKYNRGDIVGIHPRILEAPTLTGKLGFIHVTSVPDVISLEGLRAEMVRPQESLLHIDGPVMEQRSMWVGDIPEINMQELLVNRETVMDWDEVQDIYSQKVTLKTGRQVFSEFDLSRA